MAQRLPRFRRADLEAEDARKLERLVGPSGESAGTTSGRRRPDGHDWARRRGLPLVSMGVRGTAPGTDPVGALLAKESRRRS